MNYPKMASQKRENYYDTSCHRSDDEDRIILYCSGTGYIEDLPRTSARRLNREVFRTQPFVHYPRGYRMFRDRCA